MLSTLREESMTSTLTLRRILRTCSCSVMDQEKPSSLAASPTVTASPPSRPPLSVATLSTLLLLQFFFSTFSNLSKIIYIWENFIKSPSSSDLHKTLMNENFSHLSPNLSFSHFGLFNAQNGIVLMPKNGVILGLKTVNLRFRGLK
jgi:hypothetical protein